MKSLLAFMAHPDDESYGIGGTLAKYAKEGVEVHIAIMTDGSAGTPVEGYSLKGRTLAQVRMKEMKAAARILGAKLHWIGFMDSGMKGDKRNLNPEAFVNQDEASVKRVVSKFIKDVHPDVVITHDITGGYFHPDHIFVSKIVTEVVSALKPSDRPMLYHHIIPKWWVSLYATVMRLQGKDPTKTGHNKDLDLTKAGVRSDHIHACIDAWKYWDIKRNASAAHESQGGINNILFTMPKFLQRFIVSKECYMRIYPEIRSRARLTDLFQISGGN